MSHTPGPWSVDGPYFSGHYTHPAELGNVYGITIRADAATVAHQTCNDQNRRVVEANARLIAAAPDLLECLQEYVRDFGDNEDSDSKLMADKARSAIAKATQP